MQIKHVLPGCIAIVITINLLFAAQSSDIRQIYKQYCATCHGENFQGGMAKSLVDGVWQFGSERGYIQRNIQYGIPNMGMPGYDSVLNEKQISQLTDLIIEAEKTAGVKKPPIPQSVQTLDYTIKIEKWVEGLEIPWGMAFLDKNNALVTEKAGRLRVIENGKPGEPIKNTPKVLNEGQGGLLDVNIDPQFSQNGWVYLAYSHALDQTEGKTPAMTRIVRGKIKDNTWINQQIIYEAPAETYRTTRIHYGCRIVFDRRGHLFFGIGERGLMEQAQDLGLPNGKIHRIYTNGRIPTDNPFFNRPDALATIFAYGIRNPQGLSMHPETDYLWEVEHGPLGGDEVNLIKSGRNYGWPVITYGRNYTGETISELEEKSGMEQPIYYWTPSIAACACEFYSGELFRKWNNHLLVTALKDEELRLLDIKENRVLHDQVILKNPGRIRDVAVDPQGAIYAVLNEPGTILKLTAQ